MKKKNEKIDWEEQWRFHAPFFHEGKVQLDLEPYGAACFLKLQPGPGFGDFSHPTTRLVLSMIQARLKGKMVIDIGSGSGILSLAAALLGAKKVIGIEIDPEAISHAKENAKLNQLDEVQFFEPTQTLVLDPAEDYLILMNMIMNEQIAAWAEFTAMHSISGTALTSGILIEQEDAYRALMEKWGWKFEKVQIEDQWLAFEATFTI